MSTCSVCGHLWGRFGKVILLVFGFCLLLSSGARADALYLKFTDNDITIVGESTSDDHFHWSEISGVSWGVSMWGGQPYFQDLQWKQTLDKSIPLLFQAGTYGDVLDSAEIDFVKVGTDKQTYFKMIFGQVSLTSLQMNGDFTSKPIFDGAFSYNSILFKYYYFNQDGSTAGFTEASYDLGEGGGGEEFAQLLNVYSLGMAGPATSVPTPVPASLLLLGSGLLGLAGVGWRKKKG